MTENDSNDKPYEEIRPDHPAQSDPSGDAGDANNAADGPEPGKSSDGISNMASRLSSDDDEQAHILNAMQRRLERIAERTEEAKRSVSSETGDTFSRVEAALANLSEKVAAQPEPEASADSTEAPEDPADAVPAATAAPSDNAEVWNRVSAEALARHYEEEGLAEPAPAGSEPEVRAEVERPVAGADKFAPCEPTPPPAADGTQEVVYVGGAPDAASDHWLAGRFEDLAAKLDKLTGGHVTDASLAVLLERLTKLEDRIDTALAGNGEKGEGGGSLHDIEMCIAEIATQLETTNAEVARIAEIEQQITQFTQRLSEGGDDGAAMLDPQSIADLVADRLAARPMGGAGEAGYGDIDQASIGELTVMMKDFMNERRTEGEHANAVLDTMQQTTMRLLERMDALETAQQRAGAQSSAAWIVPAEAAAPPAPESQPVAAAVPPAGDDTGLEADDDLFEDEGPGPAFGRRRIGAPAASGEPVSGSDHEDEGAQSLKRLKQVLGKIDDQPEAGEAQPAATARRPGANRMPAQADDKPGARPRRKPADPAADRSRFVNAARAAAASANQRMRAAAEAEQAGEDDGELVLAGDGPAPKKKKVAKKGAKKAAIFSTRTRLLVAALALLVVGLGATKLFTSMKLNIPGFGSAAITEENAIANGGTHVVGTPVTAPASAANPASDTALGDASATGHAALPEAPVPAERLVQPAAISPEADAAVTSDFGQSIAGASRKQLPAARVGPLSMRLAAANGDASAQFAVAARFAEGRGVDQDFKEAVKWYTRSAASSFALSQYRLGTLYERGLGVEKDVQRARVWYDRAASKGNIKAMHNLAVLAAGAGTPDYTKAARWFTAAAEHGLGDSQFNLAILYQHGLGVEKNEAQAYQWFSLAALSGDGEAGKRKAEVAKSIGAAKAAEIDRIVAAWQRRPADKVANDPHVAGQQWQRSG